MSNEKKLCIATVLMSCIFLKKIIRNDAYRRYKMHLEKWNIVVAIYEGGPKRNRKRSLVGGSVVVHASAAK